MEKTLKKGDSFMGELVDKYILLGGSANAPKGTGVHSVYHVISVSMLVNRETHCIEKAKLNVPSPLTQEYFSDLVTGFCVLDAPDELYQKIKKNILTTSTGAIIQAMKMVFLRYKDKMDEK